MPHPLMSSPALHPRIRKPHYCLPFLIRPQLLTRCSPLPMGRDISPDDSGVRQPIVSKGATRTIRRSLTKRVSCEGVAVNAIKSIT